MIVLGAALPNQGTASRLLNIVIGAGFFGYGFYLLFIFGGGTYVVSADGKSLTATNFGWDSQLRQFEQRTVWDR